MLTRNCTTNLFEPKDFNVRVTLFENNPRHYVPEAYKSAWIETIRDSLGGGIVNSREVRAFAIRKSRHEHPYLFEGTGAQFIQKLRSSFQKPTSIRITVFGEPDRSWIILIPDWNSK